MTTTTRELAAQAQQLAKGSNGLQRVAANCVVVACAYSSSVKAAREALGELERPDVRAAAIELLEQLAAERSET